MNLSPMNKPMPLVKALAQAKDFLKQYYEDTINHGEPEEDIQERKSEVLTELKENGTYDMTKDELEWGARMAYSINDLLHIKCFL